MYAMLGFELGEELPCRPSPPFFHILQALVNAFLCIGASCNVQQTLICFSVLHDGCRPSLSP
jgi:hypothetical protein